MRKGDFQPNGFDLKALRKDAAKIRTEFFTTSQRPNAEDLQNAYFLHLRDSARHLQSCSTAFSSRRWATQARRMTSRGPHPNSEANVANISHPTNHGIDCRISHLFGIVSVVSVPG